MTDKPRIGVGVIVNNSLGQVLVGKRKGSFAPYYSIPGGSLELGETFEQCAIRELQEEHDITIADPEVIAVTNNLDTYRSEGLHFISVVLVAKAFTGEPIINEPDKCEELLWADPTKLPQPHFDGSRLAIECYLSHKVYNGIAE